MNANYRKGREREWRTVKMLEATGHVAYRMAGSHGAVDVIAISPLGVRLVQVKSGKADVTPADREVLQNHPRPENATVEVWRYRDGVREPQIERIA